MTREDYTSYYIIPQEWKELDKVIDTLFSDEKHAPRESKPRTQRPWKKSLIDEGIIRVGTEIYIEGLPKWSDEQGFIIPTNLGLLPLSLFSGIELQDGIWMSHTDGSKRFVDNEDLSRLLHLPSSSISLLRYEDRFSFHLHKLYREGILYLSSNVKTRDSIIITEIKETEDKLGWQRVKRLHVLMNTKNTIRYEEEQKIEEERQAREREEWERVHWFDKRNSHPRDKRIEVTTEGDYVVDGARFDSVEQVMSFYFPFDRMKYARREADYKKCSLEEVFSAWGEKSRETRENNTSLKDGIASLLRGENRTVTPDVKFFEEFKEQMKLNPYRCKWHVFDADIRLAGTIDLVDGMGGEYAIYLWTTSERVIRDGIPMKTDEEGANAKEPFGDLPNSKYYQFAARLNMYKYILEHSYRIKVSRMLLGICNSRCYKKAYVLKMPDLQGEIQDVVDSRNDVVF